MELTRRVDIFTVFKYGIRTLEPAKVRRKFWRSDGDRHIRQCDTRRYPVLVGPPGGVTKRDGT
eukprot:1358863-Amorphochlora_amoeboformis.AAC.1